MTDPITKTERAAAVNYWKHFVSASPKTETVSFPAHIITGTAKTILAYEARIAELEKRGEAYHELLYSVSQKHPGETRHETALRYIREREEGPSSEGEDAAYQEKRK